MLDRSTGSRRLATTAPTAEDALDLAELWQPALAASWRLGYADGLRAGRTAGVAETEAAWQAIFTGYAATVTQPTHAELNALREPTTDPCRDRCGRCSRCIRAYAVGENLRRYRSRDYPGSDALGRVIT